MNKPDATRHFLNLRDHDRAFLDAILDRAQFHKNSRDAKKTVHTLPGATLVNVFEKASTRTRVSFEAAIAQLGGHAITIGRADSQLGRGEPIDDTARVLSRWADVLMFRTFGDDRLQAFADASRVPVINGLSEGGHPVQVLSDLLAVRQSIGALSAQTCVFLGDCASNMALTWIEAARIWDFELRLGCPQKYAPAPVYYAGTKVRVVCAPDEAMQGATVINTDVWTSMGQEEESKQRLADLNGFGLDAALLAKAQKDAIVLHCLPAHRNEEITEEVLLGPQSRVWDQAENRLHVQKALLEWCVLGVIPS